MTKNAGLAMASTASGGIGLLAIAWLATRRLSPIELGFFFSFLSFGALVQLADFGLSYAALQTGGRLAGSGRLRELPAAAGRVTRWIVVAAGLATMAVALIGWPLFSSRGSGAAASPVAWRAPWIFYLISVFGVQLTTPGVFLREGSGKITQMWRLRLIQEWIGGIACLLALQLGGGLWSLAAYAGARALVSGSWLLFGDPLTPEPGAEVFSLERWMREVWPFQWKIGLSGLSGFLIFRAFAPVIFLEKGPVLAGQFGLAISIMNLLIAVSTAWPMSQAARLAALNTSGGFGELRRGFPAMLGASTALSAAAVAASITVLMIARLHGQTFALRLPDPVTTAVVLITAVVHHFVACYAVVLRAESREPLLIPSVVGGAVTVSALWIAAHNGTLRDVALVNLGCAAIGIPIVILLLRSRARRTRDS